VDINAQRFDGDGLRKIGAGSRDDREVPHALSQLHFWFMVLSETDEKWMSRALALAAEAGQRGEVPIGAVVVDGGEELAGAGNTREADNDPCGHAELLAIRAAAARRGHWRLDGCTVYVSLEPCAMCAGAMVLARISRCVFGATDPKGGFCGTLGSLHDHPRLNHRFAVQGGVMEAESAAMLRDFFAKLRKKGL
jgi:tRNA(adenine34) deaminase